MLSASSPYIKSLIIARSAVIVSGHQGARRAVTAIERKGWTTGGQYGRPVGLPSAYIRPPNTGDISPHVQYGKCRLHVTETIIAHLLNVGRRRGGGGLR